LGAWKSGAREMTGRARTELAFRRGQVVTARRPGAAKARPPRAGRRVGPPRVWPHCSSWFGTSLTARSRRSSGAHAPHPQPTCVSYALGERYTASRPGPGREALLRLRCGRGHGRTERCSGGSWRCFHTCTPRTRAPRWGTASPTCWEAHTSAPRCTRWASKCSALRLNTSCVLAPVCTLLCSRTSSPERVVCSSAERV
jgi:hypothetical protein